MDTYQQGELFPKFTPEQQDQAESQIIKEQQIVDYEIREYPIEVIVQKYLDGKGENNNEIFIPKYQRKYVWKQNQASKFIESVMLGLPIPYIFTADNEGRMEVVDGSQRIRTIFYFMKNQLELSGLKKLNKLNGFKHKDLPLIRQRRFNKKTLRIIELTEKATLEVRKDLFERINTTSTKLTDMQVRRGVYEGKFNDFIKECASNVKYIILCPISKAKEAKDDRLEMVLRFFAYSDNYLKFIHSVKDFVDDYMKSKQNKFDGEKMAEDFENMLDFVETYFPHGFKKTTGSKTTPRVRFEAISVGVHLALKENPNLTPQPVFDWLYSEEFMKHTKSDAANNKNKVIARIEYVRDKLLEK